MLHARPLACLLALSCIALLRAQEHPFIAAYTLTEQEAAVRIDWTIQGGSTCDGQAVERAVNGGPFEAIHVIEGICGDPTVARPYTFTDLDPVELSTLHYRVRLGTDGYTTVKEIRFEQLVTSAQRAFPNPAEEVIDLLFALPPTARMVVRVQDARGRTAWERTGIGGARVQVDLRGWAPGVYTYVAMGNGQRFSGRFVRR